MDIFRGNYTVPAAFLCPVERFIRRLDQFVHGNSIADNRSGGNTNSGSYIQHSGANIHRVIRKNGEFGKYRYGGVRKKALLGWEMAKVDLLNPKIPPVTKV